MFPSNMEFQFIKPKHSKAKILDSLSAMIAVTTFPLENLEKKNDINISFGKPKCIGTL